MTISAAENENFVEKFIEDTEGMDDDNTDDVGYNVAITIPDGEDGDRSKEFVDSGVDNNDCPSQEVKDESRKEKFGYLISSRKTRLGSDRKMFLTKIIKVYFSKRSKVCSGLSDKYRCAKYAKPYVVTMKVDRNWKARKSRQKKSFGANDLEHGRICGVQESANRDGL